MGQKACVIVWHTHIPFPFLRQLASIMLQQLAKWCLADCLSVRLMQLMMHSLYILGYVVQAKNAYCSEIGEAVLNPGCNFRLLFSYSDNFV